VPHISLVFREMWDTTALNLKCRLRAKITGPGEWHPTDSGTDLQR
jgi:hypothetical protein